jgi:hypothetical protein
MVGRTSITIFLLYNTPGLGSKSIYSALVVKTYVMLIMISPSDGGPLGNF